jgi:hypothetical protein
MHVQGARYARARSTVPVFNIKHALIYVPSQGRVMLLFRPGHPANAPYSKVTPYRLHLIVRLHLIAKTYVSISRFSLVEKFIFNSENSVYDCKGVASLSCSASNQTQNYFFFY